MPARSLTGQVIAITGASSGIGGATAMACAQAGMDVVLGARRIDRLEEVATKIRALGRKALPVACDVDRDDDVDRFIATAVATFGRLDAAFANAGYGINQPVMNTTDAQMRAIFETNFYGTMRVIHAAVPALRRAGGGRLLICSSAASELTPPGYGPYGATKAAQDSVASALRAELTDDKIFVTSIHPVGTSTEFLDRVSKEAGRKMHSNTPGGFQQTPQDVARSIVRNLRSRRPNPEVWPVGWARYVVALSTACPRLTARMMARRQRQRLAAAQAAAPSPAQDKSP